MLRSHDRNDPPLVGRSDAIERQPHRTGRQAGNGRPLDVRGTEVLPRWPR